MCQRAAGDCGMQEYEQGRLRSLVHLTPFNTTHATPREDSSLLSTRDRGTQEKDMAERLAYPPISMSASCCWRSLPRR